MKNIKVIFEHKCIKFVQKYSGGIWGQTNGNIFLSLVKYRSANNSYAIFAEIVNIQMGPADLQSQE